MTATIVNGPAVVRSATVRVVVVDDSVVVRRLVSQVLAEDPGIEVVGTAANGRLAVAKVDRLHPDLVTMDVEMPVMDGITTVRTLRRAGHRMPIVMFSTLTERGAAATLDALTAGASDYVAKPTGTHGLQEALQRVGRELIPKIHALVPRRGAPPAGHGVPAGPWPTAGGAPSAGDVGRTVRLAPSRPRTRPAQAVVLGSSTGGPAALAEVLGRLTRPPRVPVVVVQHMPPVFTRQLADRLDRIGPAAVTEAEDGEPLLAGHVYVAPGGRHLTVVRDRGQLRARLADSPPVNYCRPSVDILFRSAVGVLGADLLAVVLTGMGADGAAGAGSITAAGGTVLVQDQGTSVVWGMPGATAMAGHAHAVLPLPEIAPAMEQMLGEAGR